MVERADNPGLLIATTGWDVESWAARIRPLLPGRRLVCADRSGVYHGGDETLAGVHYVLAWKPRQDLLARLPDLRVIFSLGAGVDHILKLPSVPEVPLVRIVDPDLTGRMTEYVVWQVLHHLRRGGYFARCQRERRWAPPSQPAAREVTVGIMGMGVMGSAAASTLLQLGFPVRGWSRSGHGVAGVQMFAGPEGLDRFLAGTDILVALLPLTPETAGLIDMALLRKLRQGGGLSAPVLINAGRGGSQVEADIAAALSDGIIGGASLDVFQEEPLRTESPLWDFDNLVITPHVAADSDPAALSTQVADQILAYERGEPLRNQVDRSRGY